MRHHLSTSLHEDYDDMGMTAEEKLCSALYHDRFDTMCKELYDIYDASAKEPWREWIELVWEGRGVPIPECDLAMAEMYDG